MLTLHACPQPQRPAVAAFLAGDEPLGWLRELDRWGLATEALACYVVPESVRSVRAAGLLVVPLDATALPTDCREPCGVVAGRLYLPTHAALRPAATEAELRRLLRYEVLFWHPRTGLVGFEAEDRLHLSELVSIGPARPADWTRARPGPAAPPPLRQIRVLAPTLAQVLEEGRDDIGTAPLTELPGQPAPPSALAQALAALRRGALRTGLAAGQALETGLDALDRASANGALAAMLQSGAGQDGAGGGGGNGAGSGQAGSVGELPPGPLDRLRNYLTKQLNDLERERHQEILRLLTLLDQDMAQALRFAIPLDSPYLNRGTAAPGSRLSAGPTDFSLRQLGGGQRTDAWDLSEFEDRLRAGYLRAATEAVAAGHHRRAAYIHAHLLGDFRAAARVLEQGRFFREAAVLYQEHLQDLPAAAAVLERGELLTEALAIYLSLNNLEKAGDLHQLLHQPAEAVACYERLTEQATFRGDTLLAARVLADKLRRPAEAEALLLTGWTSAGRQPEAHLQQYLKLLAATRPAAELPAAVRALYQQHTPPARHGHLLDGLLQALPARRANPALQAEVQALGLDIISQEVRAGQPRRLHLLRKLLPQDRLLAADTSRYVTRPKP